jgi:hypothetical protein
MAHLTNTNSHNTACCRELQCTCLVRTAVHLQRTAENCPQLNDDALNIYMGLRDRKNEKKRK